MSERPESSTTTVQTYDTSKPPPISKFHWADDEHRLLVTDDGWSIEVDPDGAYLNDPGGQFSAVWRWDDPGWKAVDLVGNDVSDHLIDFKPDPSWQPKPKPGMEVM